MATHDHDISQYPGAPQAPIKFAKSEAEKDKAVNAFLAKLAQDGAAADEAVIKEFVLAVSAVISGELKDANLVTKLQNAPVAAAPGAPAWKSLRDGTVAFFGYAPAASSDQVAIHYQHSTEV